MSDHPVLDGRDVSRRRYMAGVGALGGGAVLAGCTEGGDETTETGGDGGTTDSGGGTTGGGDDHLSADVTVTHWPQLMYCPPYQAAMDQGDFEEEGITIESVAGSSGGGTTVRNVVTGGLPFGEVSTPAAVNAYYAGAPVTIVAAATNTPGTINWVVPQDSDLTDVTDLAGTTVGYTSAGSVTQNTSALAVKRADGISVDDVEFQAMGGVGEGLTALEEGAIDAAANLEPVFSSQQADGEPWKVVFWAADYIPEFTQTCLIVGPDILEERPEKIAGYIRARNEGVEFVRNNPDEAAEIFASHNDGYDASMMRQAIDNVGPDDYYATGGFTVEGLQLIEEGMRNIDLIDRNVEWTEIVDQSALPEDDHIDLSEAEQ